MRQLLIILLLLPALSFGQMFGDLGYYFVPATGGSSSNEWNVEISHTLCGTANSDTFTVCVKLQSDSLKPTYKGGLTACLLGNDIRFYVTDTNTLLNWAVERYDPDSGILIAWVKIYSVSYTTATTFKMDCGRTTDTAAFKGGATGTAWKSTVIAAYFMNDATGNNLTDNSAYGNTATQTNSPVRATGQIGYAEQMTAASTQYYSCNMTAVDGIGAESILFWGKRTSSGGMVINGKHNGASTNCAYMYSDGYWYYQLNATYGYFADNTTNWTHAAYVYDGSATGNANRCKIFKNAAQQSLLFAGTIPATTSTAGSFRMGRDATTGDLANSTTDMLIIYNVAVSTSWITTSYNNQNNPGNLGSAGFLRFYH